MQVPAAEDGSKGSEGAKKVPKRVAKKNKPTASEKADTKKKGKVQSKEKPSNHGQTAYGDAKKAFAEALLSKDLINHIFHFSPT